MDDLVKRDGLYYKKFTEITFTGNIKSKLIKGRIKHGREEGPWITYHKNGQLQGKGTYKDGKREGPWIKYHPDGQLDSKGNYKDGKKEGAWVDHNRFLDVWFNGTYKDGRFHGHGTLLMRNGFFVNKYVGEWKNGERQGHGTETTFDKTKYVGEWKDGRRWKGTEYDKDGKVIATYSEGVRKPVK